MKTILCTSPIAAQMIRKAKFADYIPKIFSDFIFTPMPAVTEGLEFYDAQVSLFKKINKTGYGYYSSQQYLDNLRKTFEKIGHSQTIELWVEHSLNSHIHCFHLLTVLAGIPNIEKKLVINHTSRMVGLMNPEMISQANEQHRVPVTSELFKEANIYWNAFRSSNPEKWVELLNKPSHCFPLFNRIKKIFLLQLPLEPTGLRLVDRQILKYVSKGPKKVVYVLGNILADEGESFHILTEGAIWDAIFALAAAPNPAITGLPLEPFNYYSYSDSNNVLRKKCFESEPKLTAHGETLLNGVGNWMDFNEIDYWWGGTHITKSSYYSFDPTTEKLKEPPQN